MKIVREIADYVFSFGTFMVLGCSAFIYLMIQIGEDNVAAREKREQQVAQCFQAGMVLVDTDGGRRCARPQDLVVVK